MSTLHARIYWALVGGLFGLGAVTSFLGGIALVLLGAILLLYPATKKMMRSDRLLLWIALAAMGFAPVLLLTLSYLVSDHSTDSEFSGYWFGVLFFAAIGLAGIIGGVLTTARRQPR